MATVNIGIDIGQKHDSTALVVVEIQEQPIPDGSRLRKVSEIRRRREPVTESVFIVRHLERLPLGTSYPAVARRLVRLVQDLQEAYEVSAPTLVVDATGVGQPVVDLLRNELRGIPCHLTAATFTHGDRLEGSVRQRQVTVGKAYLVSRLQVLLQTGRIKLPRTGEAEALAEELLNFEIRVSEDAHLRAGAFKVGTHDDLVTALGWPSCRTQGERP